MIESSKGVFNVVCDANSHSGFQEAESTITLGRNFCRQIIHYSLPHLLTFMVNIEKPIKLAEKFLGSCTVSGSYSPIDEDFFIQSELSIDVKLK